MKNKNNKNYALRVATDGILGALTLTMAFLENLLPDIAFLPPGAKLGLSNIVVMFTIMTLGIADAGFIVILKSGFAFLTRGAAAFFMSISGGILSYVVVSLTVVIFSKIQKDFSYIGISVISAVIFNIGQVLAASVYTWTNLVSSYLPLLIVFGIISGTVTGIILKAVTPELIKMQSNILNKKHKTHDKDRS